MSFPKKQTCPYCEYEVDDYYAEWEEGEHLVKCEDCGKQYQVSAQYLFIGFETKKYCEKCDEPIEYDMCLCD